MAEKRIYYRTMLEAAASAENVRDLYHCDGVEVHPTADGQAVLILKGVPEEPNESGEDAR